MRKRAFIPYKEKSMNLLLTNDDGILSEGLRALACALFKKGHTVTVVAPEENNSAVSHKITLRNALSMRKAECESGICAYALAGTPADCVLFALKGLNLSPDCVLSGINHGMNLGSDYIYSGTVAGAVEGAMNGVPSIALSTFRGFSSWEFSSADFERCAQIVSERLEDWVTLAKGTRGGLNVNIPVDQTIVGERLCKLARTEYRNEYYEESKGNYRMKWVEPKQSEDEECDEFLISRGYITLTPLNADLTDYDFLRNREDIK